MRFVSLSQNKVAIVDEAHFDLLSQFRWCASLESRGRKWYAIRWCGPRQAQRKVRMHRFLWEHVYGSIPEGIVVDHINDDSLDNRISNLQLLTQAQNMDKVPGWNRSKSVVKIIGNIDDIDF